MKKCLLLIFLFQIPFYLYSQSIDMESAIAEDLFRNGVNSFHNGFLNKAYVNFEQALSRKPDRELYSYWLAETDYRIGFTKEATKKWQELITREYQIDLLLSRVEQVDRMVAPISSILNVDYALSMSIDGSEDKNTDFMGPVSICPDNSGGLFITSYVTGKIVHFNANGRRVGFVQNGFSSFNRVFDICHSDDNSYYVTEFGSNKVFHYSEDFSKKLNVFGSAGRKKGQFNGPQFITQDDKGYIYISDIGNGRIQKFSREGEVLLAFGEMRGKFPGLKLPTGIAAAGDTIIVVDQRDKVLYFFDTSGNYLGESVRGKLKCPEGITKIADNEFLIADANKLVLFDFEQETIDLISDLGGLSKRMVKAAVDLNHNIVVSDYEGNSINYLADRSLIYSGLYIQIEHVINKDFPKVSVDFTVKDSLGRPFCGLDKSNFLISEQGVPVSNSRLIYSDVRSEEISMAILMDRSPAVEQAHDSVLNALKAFFSDLRRGDYFNLISEEEQPLMQKEVQFKSKNDIGNVESFLEAVFQKSGSEGHNGRFDLGVRESVNRLLNHRGRKAVVYLTDGNLDRKDFQQYSLTRIANYLRNNEVMFFYVQMVPKEGSGLEDLAYLAKNTGGKGISIFSPRGVKNLVPALRASRNGRYVLEYNSGSNAGFGRNYLDIAIEVSHFNRTGRTRLGYYAPLDFSKKF